MQLKSYRDSFATLGEISRLKIACCLLFWKDGLCVGELVDALAESQPNISRHLKVMKLPDLSKKEGMAAGFITDGIHHKTSFIRICKPVSKLFAARLRWNKT